MQIRRIGSVATAGVAVMLATACGPAASSTSSGAPTMTYDQWMNSTTVEVANENIKVTGSVNSQSLVIEGTMHNPTEQPAVICAIMMSYQHKHPMHEVKICNEHRLAAIGGTNPDDIAMIKGGETVPFLDSASGDGMDNSPVQLKFESAKITFPNN
jgi:hypothetical protein